MVFYLSNLFSFNCFIYTFYISCNYGYFSTWIYYYLFSVFNSSNSHSSVLLFSPSCGQLRHFFYSLCWCINSVFKSLFVKFSLHKCSGRLVYHNINMYTLGTSLMVQWLRFHTPNTGGTRSIPSQGTRSHTMQLKILHAATKTLCSQINKFKRINKYMPYNSLLLTFYHLRLGNLTSI